MARRDRAQASAPPENPAAATSSVVYRGRPEGPAFNATFRISLYYGDLWVRNGVLTLDEEPTELMHNLLVREGLERVQAEEE